MYQPVHERIAVAGVFSQGSFQPKKFLWKKRAYPIEKITLSALVKDGGVRQQFYSVLSEGNLYRLRYLLEDQQWELAEIWYEG